MTACIKGSTVAYTFWNTVNAKEARRVYWTQHFFEQSIARSLDLHYMLPIIIRAIKHHLCMFVFYAVKHGAVMALFDGFVVVFKFDEVRHKLSVVTCYPPSLSKKAQGERFVSKFGIPTLDMRYLK